MSLPEVLVVVAILSIVLAIGGPQVASLTSTWRLEGAVTEFSADLERARTEAIRRNAAVSLVRTGSSTYRITFLGERSLGHVSFAQAPDSVQFAAFGPPVTGAATFTLESGGQRRSLVLNGAGFVETP